MDIDEILTNLTVYLISGCISPKFSDKPKWRISSRKFLISSMLNGMININERKQDRATKMS